MFGTQEHNDFFFVGHEECVDSKFTRYDSITYTKVETEEACKDNVPCPRRLGLSHWHGVHPRGPMVQLPL